MLSVATCHKSKKALPHPSENYHPKVSLRVATRRALHALDTLRLCTDLSNPSFSLGSSNIISSPSHTQKKKYVGMSFQQRSCSRLLSMLCLVPDATHDMKNERSRPLHFENQPYHDAQPYIMQKLPFRKPEET